MDRQLTSSGNASVPKDFAKPHLVCRITVRGAPGMPLAVQDIVKGRCVRRFDQWEQHIEDHLLKRQDDGQVRLPRIQLSWSAQSLTLPPDEKPLFMLGQIMHLFVEAKRQEYEEAMQDEDARVLASPIPLDQLYITAIMRVYANGVETWFPEVEPRPKGKRRL